MIKKNVKLKVLPVVVMLFTVIPVLTIIFFASKSMSKDPSEPKHVSDEIIVETLPVVNETKSLINPYTDPSVTVGKNYYDYQGEEESQKNSILIHDDTYIQNTGIDYISENTFDVIAILEGTVITVKEDESLGKVVEVKHENNLVSTYQSLSELNVKKGDVVTQGQILGKSGTNELDKDLGNHLHFEIYENGQSVNPNNYLNKELEEKKN